jgi:hypothetical protein
MEAPLCNALPSQLAAASAHQSAMAMLQKEA